MAFLFFFFFQAEDGIRDHCVTGVQTCALPIYAPMAESNVAPASHVGIDVAKAWLDVAVRPSGETWRVANAPTDLDLGALVERLQQVAPQVVVLEATGGYERAIVAAPAVGGRPGG